MCSHVLLLPTAGIIVRISFFFLVGPGPLQEIAVPAFSRSSPVGRADTLGAGL